MVQFIVDSNVIIDLSKVFKNGTSSKFNRRLDRLSSLFTLIADGKVELMVVPKVVEEIKRGNDIDKFCAENFMDRFCTEISLTKEEKEEALNLAYCYGNEQVNNKYPIEQATNEHCKNFADALIVAQSAVAERKLNKHMPIITQNLKDMIEVSLINEINVWRELPCVSIYSQNAINEAYAVATAKTK